MKQKRKVACAAAAVALMAAVFAGCAPTEDNINSSTPPDSSSIAEGTPSLPSESNSVSKVSDEDFENYFKENPVDQAYNAESENAYSNVDMTNLADKYSEIWEKEIDSAYQKLMEKATGSEKNQYDDEQLQWTSGKAAALEKISQDVQSQGGTMMNVTIATDTMNFYRDRAKELYRELYQYDQAYTYFYTPTES